MKAKRSARSSTPNTRSSLLAPRASDAAAVGAQIGTMIVNVIQARTACQDRCHQREVLLAAAIQQARARDAEAARRHQAFHGTLALAARLAEGGHVEQSLEVLSLGIGLLPPVEVSPLPLIATAMLEGV
ncbi:hypothetical protein [Sorangium sp. So ce1153]|uniref:hypothetical protein n=1 Tax=Sorangium sp. So ce1153 TaxID=3133333 RepID=UPI003F628C57